MPASSSPTVIARTMPAANTIGLVGEEALKAAEATRRHWSI
jgi:hypothetical protein